MTWNETLQKAGCRVEREVSMARHTTLRVGGLADWWVEPDDEAAISRVLSLCAERGEPCTILGGGSNLLVSDAGIRGVVLHLPPTKAMASVEERGDGTVAFTMGAGQPLSRFVSLARERGCVGMESLCGIPGSIGGAVSMNAGTRQGEVKDLCEAVGIITPEGARTLTSAEVGFAYRETALPPTALVVWARLVLREGSPEECARSRERMESELGKRKASQPIELPNCGSVFRNPPGAFAGQLIESLGLKGAREGCAAISDRHANFIVNTGGAKAVEVRALMARAREGVRERYGIPLVPEVRMLGEF